MSAAIKLSSRPTQEYWEIPVVFEDDHLLAGGEELLREGAADVARAAGHEDGHPEPPLPADPSSPERGAPGERVPHQPDDRLALRGLEGEALVAVTLDDRGRVLAARLERGSGHAILDEAAVRAARSLKSVPAGAGETILPVSFRLR